jgi:cephalosporin hydroxylase
VPTTEQNSNYDYFQQQLPDLLSDPLKAGKYVIVFDSAIKGLYDSFDAAYREACAKYTSNFIVQQVANENDVVEYLATVVAL